MAAQCLQCELTYIPVTRGRSDFPHITSETRYAIQSLFAEKQSIGLDDAKSLGGERPVDGRVGIGLVKFRHIAKNVSYEKIRLAGGFADVHDR